MTAECPYYNTLQWDRPFPPPQNYPFLWGLYPYLYFLASTPLSIPNGISIGSAVFAQLTAGRRYILQWTARPPISPQNCLFAWGIWTPI